MGSFGLILGAIIAAAVVFGWFKWHRTMSGGDGMEILPRRKRGRTEDASLEEFVAAYRRGEVSPTPDPAASPAPPVPGAATMPGLPAEPAPPVKREPFLSGADKLIYLVCRAGLRDHHLFAHVPLSALGNGRLDPALAGAEVGLLVCNAQLSIVAAIDILDAYGNPDPRKADYLKSLGIRHLRLSPKSLPRPEDIHALLYRM